MLKKSGLIQFLHQHLKFAIPERSSHNIKCTEHHEREKVKIILNFIMLSYHSGFLRKWSCLFLPEIFFIKSYFYFIDSSPEFILFL